MTCGSMRSDYLKLKAEYELLVVENERLKELCLKLRRNLNRELPEDVELKMRLRLIAELSCGV
jgi:hypothetical protein